MMNCRISHRSPQVSLLSILVALTLFAMLPSSAADADSVDREGSNEIGYWKWDSLPDLPDSFGVAGPFVGVSNGALIVAGGANFPEGLPWTGGKKQWTDRVHVLRRADNGTASWQSDEGSLPLALAYGVSISTAGGVLFIGGCDADQAYAEVYRATWSADQGVEFEELPALPVPLAFSSGARVGSKVFVAGGQESTNGPATNHFFSLDLSAEGSAAFAWKHEPTWPGPPRALAVSAAQGNGEGEMFYLFSGRSAGPDQITELLTDAYRFDPVSSQWSILPPVTGEGKQGPPLCIMAGSALSTGTYTIFLFGGDDGVVFAELEALNRRIANASTDSDRDVLQEELSEKLDSHPGFRSKIVEFNTITETFTELGELPIASPVTTPAVLWNEAITIVSGEVRPGVRTSAVWTGKFTTTRRSFGWINYTVLATYLLGMLGIGILVSRRGDSTNDFFLAGKRIPWWAAGISIFSTQLSAITFIAIPAKTFATDWTYLALNGTIILSAPIAVYLFLPFFHRLNVTTAYEYLELRFNVITRVIASAMFIFFQLGRIGIVLFLPSLALALATNIPVETCILIMGVITIVYTVMGGIEAVIWTDVVQTVVLLGGALICLAIMLGGSENAWSGAQLDQALDAGKLRALDLAARLDRPTLWVLLLGGMAANVVSYGTDQTVIQRYLTTPNERDAAKSIWTNAALVAPATLLFFALGTGMYLFYHSDGNAFDPNLVQADAVLPLFIAEQCPVGIAGLIIAGIFAAAMSSLDSSMNSVATAFTTDFYGRFRPATDNRQRLRIAKSVTVVVGVFGTAFALTLATWEIKSLWDQLSAFIGLFAGGVAGIFLLGMLSRRANGIGAVTGLLASGCIQYAIAHHSSLHVLLYAFTGLASCMAVGYLVSLVTFRSASPNGFTVDPGLTVAGHRLRRTPR